VIVSFHGVDGNAAVQRLTDGLIDLADEEGFVVVHPQGLMVGLNDHVTGGSGWDHDGSEVDEPEFVAAVLDELEARVCVDTARVYATGFSAGGGIAVVVACALPDRVAAVAPVSAAYQPAGCTSAEPVPIMAFHGVDDLVVPFGGLDTNAAGRLLGVRAALDAHAQRNRCTGGPDSTPLSSRVRALTWTGCEAATTLVELDDHGHAWPGRPMPFSREVLVGLFAGNEGEPPNQLMVALGQRPDTMADNVLLTNEDVDATDLMWEFFSTR
jgi:polyhydroxybutyrate depolymerase